MAKEKKVEQITDMEVDFAQWYTDICRKAELVEYASVKGFTILRPYGYAIWENIQSIMDAEFKKTGHVNVAMPVLIPESLLKKEGELVNGFAPEVAWVTMGGSAVVCRKRAIALARTFGSMAQGISSANGACSQSKPISSHSASTRENAAASSSIGA